jgi:uncharacterized protein YndB with AHSA1/START domain
MAHVLRFERSFPHSRARVWAAITDVDRLREWFVAILDYDRSELCFADGVGAELTFVPTADGLPTGHGVVTRFDPPHLLEYTWDGEMLRWELQADGESGCRLVFTNTLDDPEAAAAVEPGWQAGLDGLAAVLAVRP